MSKLLIWFQTLADELDRIVEPFEPHSDTLQHCLLSAYQVDDKNRQSNLVFSGSLNEFLDNKNLYETIKDVIVYLPAKTILYKQLKVPSGSRNRIKQALPFLLEDYLLEDSKNYFFVPGSIHKGQCNAAIISRRVMDFLGQIFSRYKLPVSMLTSEMFIALDQELEQDASWVIQSQGDDYYIIHNNELAYAIDYNNIGLLFERLLCNTSKESDANSVSVSETELVLLESDNNVTAMDRIRKLAQQCPLNYSLRKVPFQTDRGLLYWPVKKQGINLLQDDYQLKNQNQSRLPYLKMLLILTGFWLLSQALFMTYQWYYYDRQEKQLEQQLENEFFSLFPEARRLIDVRVQTTNRLSNLTSGQNHQQGFLNLLAQVGSQLKTFKGIELININYNNRTLLIELRSREFIFNRLKARLSSNSGLIVTELSSSKDDQGIHSVISVKNSAKSGLQSRKKV